MASFWEEQIEMISSVMQILVKCLCVLCHAIDPNLALPVLDILNESDVIPSELRPKSEVLSVKVKNFFSPVTCRPKANRAVLPCRAGEHINQTLCLKHKCCVSAKKHVKLDCYAPLEDRSMQIVRYCGVGIGSVMIIACLPFCCFILEKSRCVNPLRRSREEEGSEEESEDEESSDSDTESMDLIHKSVGKQKTKKKT